MNGRIWALKIEDKKIKKGDSSFNGSGIILTNNKIKYIIMVFKSFENWGILLKGATRKITCQDGRFLNFLIPLMIAVLSLMKNVLTPFAKSVLLPLRSLAGVSAVDAAIQTKRNGSGIKKLTISNKGMEDIMKIVK